MPATQRKCIYGGLTLVVDRRYIGSVTATKHQEKGIITLESNPSRGTVLQAPHGPLQTRDETSAQEKSASPALLAAPAIKVFYVFGMEYGYYYIRDFILVMPFMRPFQLTPNNVLKIRRNEKRQKYVFHTIPFPVLCLN